MTLTQVYPYQATQLVMAEGTDFDAWREQGHALQQMAVSIMWWVGDWINWGFERFGEHAAAAVAEQVGYSEHTVQNAAWVAKAVPPTSRRRELSWSHHAETASLPQPERDEWLDRAESEGWTRADLRREMGKAKAMAEPAHAHRWVCRCGAEMIEGGA